MSKSKEQIETQISEAIVKFEKEYMGIASAETKTCIIKDAIFVRLKGVLTPAEEQLAKTVAGAQLVKRTRVQLLEGAQLLLENIVVENTACQVRSLHTDISTKTGERIIVFTLDQDLEEKLENA